LTITSPAGKNPTLKNITGTVVYSGMEAQFSGIRRAKDRANNLVDNHWEFVSFKWKEDYPQGNNLDHDNSLFALDVSDDAGDPLIMFRYAYPGVLGHTWYLDLAAKKERMSDKYDGRLSNAEKARLGMDAHYPDVKAAAQAVAVETEEEGESGSDTDEEVQPKNSKPRFAAAGKRKPDSSASSEISDIRPKRRKMA
jgi:hypothetical protein